MKCEFVNDSFRRSVIRASPGEYDGFPTVQEIFTDGVPLKVSQFRGSVGACLPFLPKINGELDTESALFPLTASLLGDVAPFEVMPTKIEWQPKDIPSGSGVLLVSSGRTPTFLRDELLASEPDATEVRFLRSDEYHGALSTTRSMMAGSNLWLVHDLEGRRAYLDSLIAFGTLFAEDFDARRLVVVIDQMPDHYPLEGVARVVESVGLQLEVVEVSRDTIG